LTEPLLDAAALVGLLADDDRRRCVAALVLGATEPTAVARATGLDTRRTAVALGRLVDAGLVETVGDGSLALLGEAFRSAARAARAAQQAATADPTGDAPPEVAKVLRAFVHDGRLVAIPMQRSKRLVVLDLLAQEFEPGRRYSEAMVNLILGRWHADTASLRRYLVDEGFLDREAGQYWRTGGSLPV
jgi:hypothetical protein